MKPTIINKLLICYSHKANVMCCTFWKWLKEMPYSDCPKCHKKGVRFSHEEHFTPGSPNVYNCKFCKEYFI